MANIKPINTARLEVPLTKEVAVTWQAPSNIALVKYWGKTGIQLPVNPSLSMTLSVACTITTVTALPRENEGPAEIDFYFDGKPEADFGNRIETYLNSIASYMPILNQVKLKIETHNTFPHSTGIASSASAFSALALCLCSLEAKLCNVLITEHEFRSKASYLARLGSGSACRSVLPGFALWGFTVSFPGSSDQLAVQTSDIHPDFYTLHDAILIVHDEKKKVSSSEGHNRMIGHPFAKARVKQANENVEKLLVALKSGDKKAFIQIVENEALTLHALMMTSKNGFMLMYPQTIDIINRIQQWRLQTGIDVCFTLDAGPNIHLMFFEKDFEQIQKLIVEELSLKIKQNRVIYDSCGKGPVNLA